MVRAAEWIAADLTRIGFEHVEVAQTAGHPIVYADWLHAPDAPTILVYCHYDVQPVDPIELWETAPFDPFVRDGRMVGRGSSDDKGQLHMHLKAAEAILATRGALPLNLRFVFEGEEESTSANLPGWLAANRDRLTAEAVVISDTGFFEGNIPAITTSLRGMLYTQIDVIGRADRPPLGQLRRGRPESRQRAGADHHRAQGERRHGHGPRLLRRRRPADARRSASRSAACRSTRPPTRSSSGSRRWCPASPASRLLECSAIRPTLDVNGIWGGFTGEGSKTIIPAHAHAKVSCRLVPDQDGEKLFEKFRDFVLSVAPKGVTVEVQKLGTARSLRTNVEHPVCKAAARALKATFGMDPVYIRSGGSIPVAPMFEELLGLPVVMLGFTNPDDNAHAPNETMVLLNYETGLRTIARLWDDLGAMTPQEARMGGTTA